ncbi:hypothetical protein [Roseovarius phycicola]|uniref:Uncharacterized protein n=1 Tax=Roseovarius phycicola TaxID=3080976 RepID=A0ABZ2HCD0_9RHOB
MGTTEDLADDLALKVIKYVDTSGDDGVITDIVNVLGATSQSAEEAFLTALRVRRANQKARELLVQRVKKYQAKQAANAPAKTEVAEDKKDTG